MNVGVWLRELGLDQYEAAFRENGVDAEVLPTLTGEELKDIGVSLIRHRRRLLEAIAALRSNAMPAEALAQVSPSAPPDLTGLPGASETIAERRPLSVMFCDLIGSTALSSRLDAEDLREIIRGYQACVASTIQQFNGFIARYVGDGVLIYFGWPQAHETDAERAVRAGLAVATAVSETQVAGQTLQVRIGIATGLVVIGEPIGAGDSRQQTAVGETPNVAARLQSLAGPNQVVIDAATHRQIGGLFTCQELGTIELKGLPEPVPAWQVLSAGTAEGRFEALHGTITPLVGRDEEMELLLRRWAQAKAGNGKVVLIPAEPGVGKSRLAEVLAERIAAEPHIRMRWFCSPYHQDSALYPVIAQMERAAGFMHGDEPAARLSKLQALLAAAGPSPEDVTLIASLHALPTATLPPLPDLTPQRKKEKTFEALLHQLEALARQQPVLLVFDDVHWIDPSSRELLDYMVERTANWPVLLLILFRPEFQPPWTGQPHVTLLTLPRLDRQATAAMVANVAGDAALPPEIVAEISERTDGIPLFVEELTKAVLEAGTQAPATLSAMPHPGLSVPPTLHASLMARLDRLGHGAQEGGQIGAVLGREFSHELIRHVAPCPEADMLAGLKRLVEAGLLFCRGTPPHASYLFKHALVQDAAYGSLLRTRCRELHARVAAVLERHFAELFERQPELLAHHLTAAGNAGRAVNQWLKAGRHAAARLTYTEAIAHLERGLAVLSSLPEGSARDGQEIALQRARGLCLVTAKGAVAARPAYVRAHALAGEQGNSPQQFEALYGVWQCHHLSGGIAAARPFSDQLVRMSEREQDSGLRLQAHHSGWSTALFAGEPAKARDHADAGRRLYDPEAHQTHRLVYGGNDPGGCARYTCAVAEWLLGYPETALASIAEALALSGRIAHPFTSTIALMTASVVHLN